MAKRISYEYMQKWNYISIDINKDTKIVLSFESKWFDKQLVPFKILITLIMKHKQEELERNKLHKWNNYF